MQKDFHYYATYCAAYIAGYTHEECLAICYSAQFVDLCSAALLSKLKAPREAATTQLTMELADARTDIVGLQNITRIWASFHFLPYDLYASKKRCGKRYLDKYRLICNPNGALVKDTVWLAKNNSLQAVGIAMHVLADTWAHRYFAGTPSLVINNVNKHFFEILPDGTERSVAFKHKTSGDDLENGVYTGSIFHINENSIMSLGHGRAGHLPDYSFIKYRYLPAWGEYEEIIKDNPSDYFSAFCQMVYALDYLRGNNEEFETDRYDTERVSPWEQKIKEILAKRQDEDGSCGDWKRLCEEMSGKTIPDFDVETYQSEYVSADGSSKDDTFLGKFIVAALAQKSMVVNKIFNSGNLLAGFSVEFENNKFRGIKAYFKLVEQAYKRKRND